MLPANRPDHEVGWPRAVQTGVAILGACAFGAVALSYGYGFGGGGRAETYPQAAAVAAAAPSFYGAGANEPGGLTVFYDYAPSQYGADQNLALGTGTGDAFSEASPWATRVDTVTDDGQVSLIQVWEVGDGVQGAGINNWTFAGHYPDGSLYPGWTDSIGALDKWYARYEMKLNSGWEFSSSGLAKQIGLSFENGGLGLDWLLNIRESDAQRHAFQVNDSVGTANSSYKSTVNKFTTGWPTGSYVEVEVYYNAQDVAGDTTATLSIWLDGTPMQEWQVLASGGIVTGLGAAAQNDTVNLATVGIQPMSATSPGTGVVRLANWPLFNGGTATPKTQQDTVFIRGFYMSGRR
jgi:hypothetical protein